MVELAKEYGSQGFKVLCFPCNQFGKQEPGDNEEIKTTVRRYDPELEHLVLFEKDDVNGANAREVFTFLKEKLPWDDGSTNVMWNFGKFLVDHEGNPYKRYGSKEEPNSMKDAIEALLEKRNNSSK